MKATTRRLPHFLRRLIAAQVLGIYAAATLIPTTVYAAPVAPPASLSQVPQFLQFPPSPNVFITVDNSSSMAQELLPDIDQNDNVTPQRMFPMPLRSPYAPTGDGLPELNLVSQALRF